MLGVVAYVQQCKDKYVHVSSLLALQHVLEIVVGSDY